MKIVQVRNLLILLCAATTLFAYTGCGPTEAEIRAREQQREQARLQMEARMRAEEESRRQAEIARRQAEEAARKAEEARLAKIRSIEVEGDKAAQVGDPSAALANYTEVLNLSQDRKDEDYRLREKIIRLVTSSKMTPVIPEEARRHAVRAQALVKAKQAAGFPQAVTELSSAMLLAPWWADGYYNLGLMQEGAEDFTGAIQSLKLCLLADPNSKNSGAIQNKIYQLEVFQEEADKVRGMAGGWKNIKSGVQYTVTMNGKNFNAVNTNNYIIRGVMDGNTIEGTITVPSMKVWDNCDCRTPEYTVPITGKIAITGKSITFNYMWNNYTSTYWTIGPGQNRTGHYQGECISVTLAGSSPDEITIAR
ncbi:MAG TPA: hypothetical protein VLZ07_13230 [Syntrophales bacterium]|nr:hypothetical protein [Syntrophales bacterium]